MRPTRASRGVVRVFGTVAFDTVGLVERLPSPDTTARVTELAHRFGGTGGNVAVALARLGVRPTLVAAVGPDFAGSDYERRLLDLGVDLSALVRTDQPTAHAYVWSAADHGQATYFHPGASRELAKAEPRPADLAHFGAGEMSAYAPHMERAAVATLDPGQEVFHRRTDEIVALFPLVDVLFLNGHEAARLRRDVGFDDAAAWRHGMKAVVLTRGRDGCEIRTPEGVEAVPAVPARAVDPTGAGDAHRAGFLFGLENGLPYRDCARLASVCAAFAVEAVGPQEGLPGLDAVRRRYEAVFGPWPLEPASKA